MRGLLAFGLVGLLGVGVSTATGGKDDQAKLQGKWDAEVKGMKFTLTFAKDQFTFEFPENATFKGTFKIDPKLKPKQIDLTIKEGPAFEGKTALGVYELDGDTLRWSAAEPGKEE